MIAIAAIGTVTLFSVLSSRKDAPDEALSEAAGYSKHAASKAGSTHEGGHRQRTTAIENSTKIDQSLTPQKAKELLEKSRLIVDITERSKYCSEIIAKLCEAGYSEEAWQLIDTSLGQVRQWQISAFFRTTSTPDSLLSEKFKELNNSSEVSSGMTGLLKRHENGDLVGFLTSQNFKALQQVMSDIGMPINLNQALSPFLQAYVWDNGEKDVDAQKSKMQLAIDIYRNNLLNQEVMTEILKSARLLSPSEKIEYMDSLGDLGHGLDHLQAYRRRVISDAVRANPEAAISTAFAKPPGQQNAMDINNTIRSWIMVDSEGAADWYARNAPSFTDYQRDAAASGFFAIAMDEGQYETARTWIDGMSDSNMKAGSLKFWEATIQEQKNKETSEAK